MNLLLHAVDAPGEKHEKDKGHGGGDGNEDGVGVKGGHMHGHEQSGSAGLAQKRQHEDKWPEYAGNPGTDAAAKENGKDANLGSAKKGHKSEECEANEGLRRSASDRGYAVDSHCAEDLSRDEEQHQKPETDCEQVGDAGSHADQR